MKFVLENKLLICVGAGGVGKTSMAAAIGLHAAIQGKKVLVLTIDPARRLANSLGLNQFGNEETQIDISSQNPNGGELWAMMLDGKKAFHDLINRIAKDEKHRDTILSNNIYKSIADTIVGNQEYMATEKLYDVVSSDRYELVILDTPPVKNALDFLDSPGRMARFVDKRIMKWFLEPAEKSNIFSKVVNTASSALFRLLGYVFGEEFLNDIAVFFYNFRDLYEGFQDRHQAVEKIFRAETTSFIIVAAPNIPAMEVAHFFLDELRKRKLRNPVSIINQRHFTVSKKLDVIESLKAVSDENSDDLEPHVVQSLLARLGAAHRRLQLLSKLEEKLVMKLQNDLDEDQLIFSVPRIHGEVHDLVALNNVGNLLFNTTNTQ